MTGLSLSLSLSLQWRCQSLYWWDRWCPVLSWTHKLYIRCWGYSGHHQHSPDPWVWSYASSRRCCCFQFRCGEAWWHKVGKCWRALAL